MALASEVKFYLGNQLKPVVQFNLGCQPKFIYGKNTKPLRGVYTATRSSEITINI